MSSENLVPYTLQYTIHYAVRYTSQSTVNIGDDLNHMQVFRNWNLHSKAWISSLAVNTASCFPGGDECPSFAFKNVPHSYQGLITAVCLPTAPSRKLCEEAGSGAHNPATDAFVPEHCGPQRAAVTLHAHVPARCPAHSASCVQGARHKPKNVSDPSRISLHLRFPHF